MVFDQLQEKSKKRGIQEQGTGYDQDVEVRLSASTYDGACLDPPHLYHYSGKNKEETSPHLWLKLFSYKKCSRRLKASEKQDIVLKLTERNKELYFQAYKRFAENIYFEARRLNTLLLTPF